MRINYHMTQCFDDKVCRGLRNYLKHLVHLKQRQVCDERANHFPLADSNIALYAHKMFGYIHTCLQSVL
ncbi:MAG: hypothetical protein ABIL62_19885, partial [Planctomycetota bacterium]